MVKLYRVAKPLLICGYYGCSALRLLQTRPPIIVGFSASLIFFQVLH